MAICSIYLRITIHISYYGRIFRITIWITQVKCNAITIVESATNCVHCSITCLITHLSNQVLVDSAVRIFLVEKISSDLPMHKISPSPGHA